MKTHTIEELNKLYDDGEQADSAHYSEMRTNVLLFIGEHYKKKAQAFVERNADKLSETSKLKLQENHIQLVCQRYITNIVNLAPGCLVEAYNKNELADQKDAELSLAVMRDGENKLKFEEKLEEWANALVVQGECASFTYWNPTKGKLVGYRQKTNEQGEPLFSHPEMGEVPMAQSEMGQALEPVKSDEPVFQGELVTDVVHAFNLIRHKSAESFNESPFICVRKMTSKEEAKALLDPNDEQYKEKVKYIEESSKTSYKIFDSNQGKYSDSEGQCTLRYFFFRQCNEYPEGYFYLATEVGILSEGPIPFGVFPIAFGGFRKAPTSPRYKSIIRDIRHPQLQLNYLISKQAYHVSALGDDKVITQMGSKLTKGQTWAGIREWQVNGNAPTIIAGRAGSHLDGNIDRQVQTIYKLADLDYNNQETDKGQDVQAKLYANLSQKAKFSPYAKKFERFMVDHWNIYLELARHYFTEDRTIMAVGRREAINIQEFKNTTETGYRIKVKPANSDIDSMMGKGLYGSMIMQYLGKDIPQAMQGRLIRMMPYLNDDQLTNEMTLTDENIDSDILSLDRGEYRPANPSDEHNTYIKRLEHRRKQNDFAMLPDQVKQMYAAKIKEHGDIAAQQAADLRKQQEGFIPATGPTVKVDFYGKDGKRMTLPFDSLAWLVQQLEEQGMAQASLQQLDEQNQLQIMTKANEIAQQGSGPAVGMQQPESMPPYMA